MCKDTQTKNVWSSLVTIPARDQLGRVVS